VRPFRSNTPLFAIAQQLTWFRCTVSLDLGYLPFTLLHQVGGQPEPLLRSLRMYITLGLISYCSAPPRGSPLVCSFIASQNHPPLVQLLFFYLSSVFIRFLVQSQRHSNQQQSHSHGFIPHLLSEFFSSFRALHFCSLFYFPSMGLEAAICFSVLVTVLFSCPWVFMVVNELSLWIDLVHLDTRVTGLDENEARDRLPTRNFARVL